MFSTFTLYFTRSHDDAEWDQWDSRAFGRGAANSCRRRYPNLNATSKLFGTRVEKGMHFLYCYSIFHQWHTVYRTSITKGGVPSLCLHYISPVAHRLSYFNNKMGWPMPAAVIQHGEGNTRHDLSRMSDPRSAATKEGPVPFDFSYNLFPVKK